MDPAAKKQSLGAEKPLAPRVSFLVRHEQKHEYSANCTEADVSFTKEIFTDVLDIVASQARLLTSMNERLFLAESDLRRELEQFAAAASHDTRGPLRMIKLAASLAQEDAEDVSSDPSEHLSDTVSASNRLGRLTDSMLSYTRLCQGQVTATSQSVDFGSILDQLTPAHRLDMRVKGRHRIVEKQTRSHGQCQYRFIRYTDHFACPTAPQAEHFSRAATS